MRIFPPNSGIFVKIYSLLIFLTSHLSSLFLLAMRVTWGWQFFISGRGKLRNLDGVTQFFSSLHIPAPHFNAILAASTECFGGLFLIAGLGARFWAAGLTITMIVAYATAEWPDIHDLDTFVKAAPFPFLITSLVVMMFGPGLFSIDGILKATIFKRYTEK
jgi:putative oxidoreductase